MISDSDIAQLLDQAAPLDRVLMQRLVDRIRFAEGGGVRRELDRLSTPRPFTFMGIPSDQLTRDELLVILNWMQRDRT